MELNTAFSQKLRTLRGNRTQKEIADALGLGVSTICLYENAKRIPKDDIKIKLAEYFGTTVQDLFFEDVEEE